jgi:serine/threonine-protein kinase
MTAPQDPLIGTLLDGRYRLERTVGRGGMGRVYGAEHVGIARQVAIKVLDPQLVSDDGARKRFEREAQSTGRLRHANCVGVTDFGTMPDGSPYLAMELVEGATLDQILDEKTRLPVADAVRIMRHILRGLAHAHAQGLIHRDLKPANIMLVAEGGDPLFAKLLDFGLARLVSGGGDRLTQTGIICGTPRYMAPEQVMDRALDPRIDLYAASIIFFEMLTGRTPFDSDEAVKILRMHVQDEVPAVAAVAPDVAVPPALEKLLRKGLAKSPDDRPQTADEYLAALDRAVPATAPPAPSRKRSFRLRLPARLPHLTRQHKLAAVAAGTLLLVIIVILATSGGDDTAVDEHDMPELEMDPTPVGDPEIESALKLARSGRGQDAVNRLRAMRKERPTDAQVPYALGRVCNSLGWPRPTLEAYRDAIKLDPGLREDPVLIQHLVGLLDSRSTWQSAARMLETEIGAPARAALEAVATRDPSPTIRERAARIAAKLR